MDKEKQRDRRRNSAAAALFYRKALRLIRRQKRETVILLACVLVAGSAACVVWALVKSRSAENVRDGVEMVTDVSGEPINTMEPLEKDAQPEVNELVSRYFTALQQGDEAVLRELRDNTENKELFRMQENSNHIESYNNLSCYTKSGMEEDSYVVFAYYEVKFDGIDTLLPGLTPLYVRKNEAGAYYFYDFYQDRTVGEYISQIAADEDVEQLYTDVGEEYSKRLLQDENLSVYMQEYVPNMKAAVGEALEEEAAAQAAREKEAQQATAPEPGSSGSGSSAPSGSVSVPNSGEFTVSDTVNIRKIASESADKVGVCYPGESLEILMKQADGWTRVSFQGETGYVRSDVLK